MTITTTVSAGPRHPAYTDRSWPERLQIMQALEQVGSELYEGHVHDGFTAAIGVGKTAATVEAMRQHGFTLDKLCTFPLGSDKPALHLRHDALGAPQSNWLLASFVPDLVQT